MIQMKDLPQVNLEHYDRILNSRSDRFGDFVGNLPTQYRSILYCLYLGEKNKSARVGSHTQNLCFTAHLTTAEE